jgi:hypothetical protein
MTTSLREWITRFSCLMVILSSLTYVGTCLADMPNPGPQKHEVEIQGAKIISEGGYLWFHVINHDYRELYVTIQYPSDVKVIGAFPTTVCLNTGGSADFYFQVPYYWNGSTILIQQNSTRELKLHFEIYTLYHGAKTTDENVEFDVDAVPLARVNALDSFFLAVLTTVAVVITVILIVARLDQQKKRKRNSNDRPDSIIR